MSESNYFERIPLWNAKRPSDSFDIIADEINGRIPVTRLEHWRDFSDLLESDFFNHKNIELIFRGHRRYDWGMMPTLARIASNGIISEDLALRQLAMFRKAIRGRVLDHSLLDNSDGEADELWSIGQHHGLMTPLLDWTYSPYVALFFAFAKEDVADEQENPYRAVYILNKSFVANDNRCPDIRVFEPRKDDHGRLVSQAGLFTFSPYDSTIENKLTDVLTSEEFKDTELKEAAEDEQSEILARYICKVYIKNEEQQECLKYLRRMNVHHASLFPDLIGAAEYCNVLMSELEREQLIATEPEQNNSTPSINLLPAQINDEVPKKNIASIYDLLKSPPESKEVEAGRIDLISSELSSHLSKLILVPDWEVRDSIRSEMLNLTRVILRKYGYPINAREPIIKGIIGVMEKVVTNK